METQTRIISYFLIAVIIYGNFLAPIPEEGFGIYLTQKNIPPNMMEAYSYVELASHPLISSKDIINYNAETHEIALTSDAFGRISNLDIPVSGKSFLVCINQQPIYWGAFWTLVSSISFDGVTICITSRNREQKTIILALGYPSLSFYTGLDPRNNIHILDSLEKSNKLISIHAQNSNT